MSKKFVFSVGVKSRKKMALHEANNVINVMFAVANFCQEVRFHQKKFGICIQVANKPIVSWQATFVVLLKPLFAS